MSTEARNRIIASITEQLAAVPLGERIAVALDAVAATMQRPRGNSGSDDEQVALLVERMIG